MGKSKQAWTPERYRQSAVEFLSRFPNHTDCVDFVGNPPDDVTRCQGWHGLSADCTTCGWNRCFVCKDFGKDKLLCVKCGDITCAGCLSLPSFRGWMGRCQQCHVPVAPPPPPPIVVEDDTDVVADGEPICSKVHQMTDVCVVCKLNCCKYCHKPRRESAR